MTNPILPVNCPPPPPVHSHHCALYLRMSGLEKIEQHKIAKCPLYSCTEDEQWKKTNISHCHFQYSVFVNSYPGWYWWHSASAGELKGKKIGQCWPLLKEVHQQAGKENRQTLKYYQMMTVRLWMRFLTCDARFMTNKTLQICVKLD